MKLRRPLNGPDDPREPRVLNLDVVFWRYEQLEGAGYPTDVAVMLAERADVDLHRAVALLEKGATIHEALRILT